jgi:DNA adenine methylase
MAKKSKKDKPFIRWVGGKRKLLTRINALIPAFTGRFCEPFVGGGAIALSRVKDHVIAGDANAELINFYVQVQEDHEGVYREYKNFVNTPECYYATRAQDRDKDFFVNKTLSQRAARLLFLNIASFQGLWRVNSKGYHNVPYSTPRSIDVSLDELRVFSEKIKNIEFHYIDFETLVNKLDKNDFVYFDPPYVPMSITASFTGYTIGGFDHHRLKTCCDDLTNKGIKFLLSNSSAALVRKLYTNYDIQEVIVNRTVSAKASSRAPIVELLINNYKLVT